MVYRVAINFYGRIILRIGDVLCFAGTNFCDGKRLVFLAGNKFLRFSGSRVQMELITFLFLFEYMHAIEIQVKQHGNVRKINQCHSITLQWIDNY